MKKLLNILCGLLMSASAFAQNSAIYTRTYFQNALSTVVKEVKYPSTITCVNTEENMVRFVYEDASLTTKEITVNHNRMKVLDMIVLSYDTVVFCGEVNTNGMKRGVVGFFTIQDMLNSASGMMNVYIKENFISGQSEYPVESLKKMVAYIGFGGIRHIVCIGYCNYESIHYPCVVDITGYTIGFVGYTSGYINNTKETFEDISIVTDKKMTKNFIVTAGFDSNEVSYGRYIGFRIYDPDNVLNSINGIQDTLRLLVNDATGIRRWFDDGLSLSPLSPGNFATTSFREVSPHSAYINANIHIGSFSVANILNGSFSIMNSSVEIPFVQTNDRKSRDLIYSAKHKFLVFLHDATDQSTGEQRSYYSEIPESIFSTPGIIYTFWNPDIELHRLSLYNGYQNYIGSGLYREASFLLVNSMDTYNIIKRCSTPKNDVCSKYATLTINKKKKPFDSIGGICFFSEEVVEIQSGELEENCMTN